MHDLHPQLQHGPSDNTSCTTSTRSYNMGRVITRHARPPPAATTRAEWSHVMHDLHPQLQHGPSDHTPCTTSTRNYNTGRVITRHARPPPAATTRAEWSHAMARPPPAATTRAEWSHVMHDLHPQLQHGPSDHTPCTTSTRNYNMGRVITCSSTSFSIS